MWEEEIISNLRHKGETIWGIIKYDENGMSTEKIMLKFKTLMSKGNVNEVLKHLTDNMSSKVFPLTDKTLKILKQKHSKPNVP